MKNIKILGYVFIIMVLALGFKVQADDVTLDIVGITNVQTSAVANGTYESGWKWIFNVTVPENETVVKFKLSDWTSTSGNIPVANNVRYYSSQSSNAFDASTAVTLTQSDVYPSADMILIDTADLNTELEGRQIQIAIEVKIPAGNFNGSYSTTYGIKSDVFVASPSTSLESNLFTEFGVTTILTGPVGSIKMLETMTDVTNQVVQIPAHGSRTFFISDLPPQYSLVNILVDNVTISTNIPFDLSEYEFTDIQANHTIEFVVAESNPENTEENNTEETPPTPVACNIDQPDATPADGEFTITANLVGDCGHVYIVSSMQDITNGSVAVSTGSNTSFFISNVGAGYKLIDVKVDGTSVYDSMYDQNQNPDTHGEYFFTNIQENHVIEITVEPEN
jgi:hypothetical protein